ncbi:MAG: hypothetical protein GX871_08370 [Microbacteriaceae bacterium]|nr:hypothetical protein [Microbacteriaceae bacterium]
MRSSRQGAIPSDLGGLIDTLSGIEARLRTLEAPSGESLNSTVAKLQALVADIQAQIDAWAATRWTNAQIDALIDAKISARLAGNISIGGTLYVGGKVTAPGVYALNVVTAGRPRTTVWVDSIGEVGHT